MLKANVSSSWYDWCSSTLMGAPLLTHLPLLKLSVPYSLKNNQDGEFLAEFSLLLTVVLCPRKELDHRHGHLSVLSE